MAEVGIEERMAAIEGVFVQLDKRLGRMEVELSEIRTEMRGEIQGLRTEVHDLRMEVRDLREEMHRELRALYRITLAVLILMWVTIIGAIIAVILTR